MEDGVDLKDPAHSGALILAERALVEYATLLFDERMARAAVDAAREDLDEACFDQPPPFGFRRQDTE